MRAVETIGPPIDPGAIADYQWLMDRGYPESGSIKLVGDRYRLPGSDRKMLQRAVAPSAAADQRAAAIVGAESVSGVHLGVDGHNVVLTVANYLRGVPVFEANDGLLRDIGAVHGRVHDAHLMRRAIRLVAAAVRHARPATVELCMDEPISHSREHSELFERELGRLSVTVHLVRSADAALQALPITTVATSDSVVVDRVGVPVWDCARTVLTGDFQASVPSFRRWTADQKK